MKVKLTDDEWQKILHVLKSCAPEILLGAGRDVRRFLEVVCPCIENNYKK
jgi:hypothetical protein